MSIEQPELDSSGIGVAKFAFPLRNYAAFTSSNKSSNIYTRKLVDVIFKIVVVTLSLLATLPLFFIFFYIFKKGFNTLFPGGLAFNLDFFVNTPAPVGEIGGGIANAITGSILLIVLSSALALPIGVMIGIFLFEFKKSKINYLAGLSMEVLQGIPSIVIGIIAYMWIVKPLRHFSLIAGAIALAIMMLPVIAKSTEETLKLVPQNLKEASLALGAPYYLTILKVILPAGLNGIVTGVLVSIARIAGETAPLLFTAFGNPHMNLSLTKPVESLPHIIYYYATSPYDDWRATAWGASLVLITMILILNFSAKLMTRKSSSR